MEEKRKKLGIWSYRPHPVPSYDDIIFSGKAAVFLDGTHKYSGEVPSKLTPDNNGIILMLWAYAHNYEGIAEVMPRPPKCRRVASIPGITCFKPAGIPLRLLQEVCLSIDEAEAIRLKDLEDLDQEQCAQKMNISRPTFQRVLESARKTVADALLHGKAIRIEGGSFEICPLRFKCSTGHEWDVPLEAAEGALQVCPICSIEGEAVETGHCGCRCWLPCNGRHQKPKPLYINVEYR
jgi:uncharacterized protein